MAFDSGSLFICYKSSAAAASDKNCWQIVIKLGKEQARIHSLIATGLNTMKTWKSVKDGPRTGHLRNFFIV